VSREWISANVRAIIEEHSIGRHSKSLKDTLPHFAESPSSLLLHDDADLDQWDGFEAAHIFSLAYEEL
jgi:hypothetical protein